MCLWLMQTTGSLCQYSCSLAGVLLSWMGFCGVSLSPWARVDLTDLEHGAPGCARVQWYIWLWGCINHCRLAIQRLMAESQQLGTVVGWEQALDSTGYWLPALAWAGYC